MGEMFLSEALYYLTLAVVYRNAYISQGLLRLYADLTCGGVGIKVNIGKLILLCTYRGAYVRVYGMVNGDFPTAGIAVGVPRTIVPFFPGSAGCYITVCVCQKCEN